MGRLSFINEELTAMKEAGLYGNIRTIESPQGPWVTIEGRKVLNLCSNNYLGLCSHPRLVSKVKEYVDTYGVGPGAVRTIAGTMSIHVEFERRIAAFKGAEDAMLLQSGFCANLAVIPTLVPSEEDIIYSDELNHASIIDACRLSKARVIRYAHSDMEDLKRVLEETKGQGRRKLLVTDGVFSMDGDIAPLPAIRELCDRYDVILVVDDAHGEGVLGRAGRGIVDHFHLHGLVDVEVGTLSKAFGVMGGVIAGRRELIEYLRQKARPNLFSSALTVPDVAANMAALEILEESPELVERLWRNGNFLKEHLSKAGFDTANSQTPITPVMLGEATTAKEFSRRLFEKGVFATAIVYPTVPKGKARIRAMVSAAHTEEDLLFAVDKFSEVAKDMGVL
ncbi:glycine C-acetyltransferase [Thermanaerovibrio acidaminovorans]|uniref:Pyridoxal phosphate-dependent acyltransferase n=1 Tax=Thermanaerovibrio acidaminovorans (strain ATCC 49978 / DSM 6589 / Su883) TaxID=525903 RepID=D1B775_THEAS|nr:glycine C-acetyltransferase [Thermanaerovibrio acidaminovorans]ACZ19866.1 pyridoxal phosphate-dependent acyltransferase [Thermanaerovibrio acidaminovorans DSM 6589]